ncbi:MAG: MG2 domain-containing protein [Acidobacteriota bacterium]
MRFRSHSCLGFLSLVFALASGISTGQDLPQPRIIGFSPQGTVKTIRQVKVRFSVPIVPFGDPGRAAEPFQVQCSVEGKGRWIDPRNWVYDFEKDLPGGIACSFDLRSELTSLDGQALMGPKHFDFSTGGPAVTNIIPQPPGGPIEEDQVFALILDGPVDINSVLNHAYVVVQGLASAVSIRAVGGNDREQIIQSQYSLKRQPPDRVLLLQPRQTLPEQTRVRFVWGAGITSPSGVATQQEQVFDYTVRSRLRATFRCRRVNADRACIPLFNMHVEFSAPVAVDLLRGATLTGEDGRIWSAHGVEDDAGRPLSNVSEFPLSVATDEYPPLAKFSADFGIIEAADPVLPVTVRNIEKDLELSSLQVEGGGEIDGRIARIPATESQQILDWLTKVEMRSWDDRGHSVFAGTDATPRRFVLPRPHGEKSFEVIGIPLERSGFYVVELQSRILGDALLGAPVSMYVPTTALVTNLSVHLKWGLERSLVWVTRLESAEPAPGASVEVRDCSGQVLWNGVTDRDGIARPVGLPALNAAKRCNWNRFGTGLLVIAQLGDDFSFVHSDWDRGIESWRFRVPGASESSLVSVHTVLGRSLVRAGETVHMKHFIRGRTMTGFTEISEPERPTELVIRHLGTNQEYTRKLEWTDPGVALTDWEVPKDARLGTYQFVLKRDDGQEWVSGSCRVEEFRVPLMKASIAAPSEPLIQPDEVTVDVDVAYLSGGPAKKLPVLLRYQQQPAGPSSFPDFEDFVFDTGPVEVGITRYGEETERKPPEFSRKTMELDENGGRRIELEGSGKIDQRKSLLTELEFQDPNGRIQTVSQRISMWPSARLAGIKTKSWMQSDKSLQFSAAVADVAGRPVAGAPVRVELLERKYYSHRKRLVGGFYGYESFSEVQSKGVICEGQTDARGILKCDVVPPLSGNVILLASTADAQGRRSYADRSVWVRGHNAAWYPMEDDDRIDLIPEKKEYQPGETARFQVRMPFREATALVAVEREGVGDTFVKHLTADNPVVEIPVKPGYAPNIFVSALVVRGREGGIAPTAFVDLGKPSFKLGIAHIDVGWADHRLKVDVRPERDQYKIRQKAHVTIAVTDPEGRPPTEGAEVAVAVVDEGLLELAPNPSWKLLDQMMQTRGYGVQTSTAQMQVVGKRHFGLKALPSGGGGGKQLTRELFDTLLLWQPRVSLDAEGKASVEVPINDSVTSFRVVAVATAGLDRFGTGESTFRTVRDLTLYSGLPPLVREGDRFLAEFTVRNATANAMDVHVEASIHGMDWHLERTIHLGAGEGGRVGGTVEVPVGVDRLSYVVSASSPDASDRLAATQQVAPLIPVRTVQATLESLDQPVEIPVEIPVRAVAGRGGVEVDLSRSLTTGLDGVRAYMSRYPYECLEQILSKAVALSDEEAWKRQMANLTPYMGGNGLLCYFPNTSGDRGSDVLTSYVLTLADASGWTIPEESRRTLLQGLTSFVEGRSAVGAGHFADLTLRKLAAIQALARFGAAQSGMLSTLAIEPNLWPTSALLDWYEINLRFQRLPARDERLAETEQMLRSRLDLRGTSAGFSTEAGARLWWLMSSPAGSQARLILALVRANRWTEDLPRLVRGLLDLQRDGHWDLTTANALGALAVRHFAARFESETVTGSSEVSLAGEEESLNWNERPDGGGLFFPWPAGRQTLRAKQDGTGKPWLIVRANAAVEPESFSAGYTITRSVEAVERRRPDTWSVGDILRVKLHIRAQSDMTWAVVSDPVPGGGSILGSRLRRGSSIATQGERRADSIWPTYVERKFEWYRAYFDYLPKGEWTLEYTLRLNSSGEFQLPPTRVEAMYEPEVFGQSVNRSLKVEP